MPKFDFSDSVMVQYCEDFLHFGSVGCSYIKVRFEMYSTSRDFVNDDAAVGKGNKVSSIDAWNGLSSLQNLKETQSSFVQIWLATLSGFVFVSFFFI